MDRTIWIEYPELKVNQGIRSNYPIHFAKQVQPTRDEGWPCAVPLWHAHARNGEQNTNKWHQQERGRISTGYVYWRKLKELSSSCRCPFTDNCKLPYSIPRANFAILSSAGAKSVWFPPESIPSKLSGRAPLSLVVPIEEFRTSLLAYFYPCLRLSVKILISWSQCYFCFI